jgi:hypothetical protein
MRGGTRKTDPEVGRPEWGAHFMNAAPINLTHE